MLGADPDRLGGLRREAPVLGALNHPHIAQVYGLEDSAGLPAVVMQLVQGPTLAGLLDRGEPLPFQEAVAIARQIAEALEAAHEAGVVHRDLKPANIFQRRPAVCS